MGRLEGKLIQLVPDCRDKVGRGHYQRCHELARYLRENSRVDFTPVFTEFGEIVKFEQYDLVVIDTHRDVSELVNYGISRACKVVVLDNFYHDKRTLGINVFDHEVVDRTKTITSVNNIILREEILNRGMANDTLPYALICLGGADVNKQSNNLARKLHATYRQKILLVKPHWDEEVNTLTSECERIEVVVWPDNFVELLAHAEIVVCNAGTTMFEAMLLGRPVVAWPQSSYESNMARHFAEQGLIVGIGIESLANYDSFNTATRLPFDGRGGERVADLISNLLYESKVDS